MRRIKQLSLLMILLIAFACNNNNQGSNKKEENTSTKSVNSVNSGSTSLEVQDGENESVKEEQENEPKKQIKGIKEANYKPIHKFGEIQKGELLWPKPSITYFDKNGNTTLKLTFDADSILSSKDIYNEQGKLLKEFLCDSIGEILAAVSEYDENNNLICKTKFDWYRPSDNFGKISWKNKYKYNAKNQLVEEVEYDRDGSEFTKKVYTYDDDGNKETETRYSHGNLQNTYSYKYNNRGLLIEVTQSGPTTLLGDGPRSLISLETYEYNQLGQMIEKCSRSPSSREINYRHTFEYDDRGNVLTKKTYYGSEDLLQEFYTYEYKYDEYGNCILSIEYHDSKPVRLIERTFEYYD